MTTTSLLIVGLTRGGAWARDIARTTDLELAGLVEIRADPFNPSWNTSGRAFGYSVRATLADGTHVHYLTRRALARPQTTWYGDLCIVGVEGALFWNGVGPTVTLSRTLPSENYHDHHLARFHALALKGEPRPLEQVVGPRNPDGSPGTPPPELAEQLRAQPLRHLEESVHYCRDVLGIGERGR